MDLLAWVAAGDHVFEKAHELGAGMPLGGLANDVEGMRGVGMAKPVQCSGGGGNIKDDRGLRGNACDPKRADPLGRRATW